MKSKHLLIAALLLALSCICDAQVTGPASYIILETPAAAGDGVTAINSPTDHIHIYPNPSKGVFYFTGMRSSYTIEVFDMPGQKVYDAHATGDKYPVDLSSRERGFYMYRITDQDNMVQQGKLVLK